MGQLTKALIWKGLIVALKNIYNSVYCLYKLQYLAMLLLCFFSLNALVHFSREFDESEMRRSFLCWTLILNDNLICCLLDDDKPSNPLRRGRETRSYLT